MTNIDLALSVLESPSNQILKSISISNYTGMSCWVTLEICEELKWSCHKNQSQSYNIWNGNKFAVTFIKSFPFHFDINLQPATNQHWVSRWRRATGRGRAAAWPRVTASAASAPSPGPGPASPSAGGRGPATTASAGTCRCGYQDTARLGNTLYWDWD